MYIFKYQNVDALFSYQVGPQFAFRIALILCGIKILTKKVEGL